MVMNVCLTAFFSLRLASGPEGYAISRYLTYFSEIFVFFFCLSLSGSFATVNRFCGLATLVAGVYFVEMEKGLIFVEIEL